MPFDRFTLERIRQVPLMDVAHRLELKCKPSGHWYKTKCFVHDDHTPSLGLHPATGRWRCFSCGAKGDVIGLVKAHEKTDFDGACQWICEQFSIDPDGGRKKFDLSQFIRSHCMDMTHSQYLDPALMQRFAGQQNSFTRCGGDASSSSPTPMPTAAPTAAGSSGPPRPPRPWATPSQ